MTAMSARVTGKPARIRQLAAGLLAGLLTLGAAGASASAAAVPGDQEQRVKTRAAAPKEPGRGGSFELSASALWAAASTLGTSAATLTSNDTSGSRYTLFDTEGKLRPAPGADIRLAFNISRSLAVEGGFVFTKPEVETRITNDVESAAAQTIAGERLSQYLFDAALVVHVPRLRFSRDRGRPFFDVGVGYLRQLHEGNTVRETGQMYHLGGGVKYLMTSRRPGLTSGLGFRVDARLNMRSGGFAFTERVRPFVSIGGGLFATF
jgi:hypothetical protein